ncbi:hypothetical protein [Pseudorhodoplanes sp.]|uniref:hypothetical protein n=1 Tax=Pseudorhodoplanes sp. TaxID=1934341 RepID=UPI002BD2A788|nr:hypothetical protein [Pseudorhodoplanes sp.]HWV55792.1 hypothetical protein [Pseudorhodoplanes sp.]
MRSVLTAMTIAGAIVLAAVALAPNAAHAQHQPLIKQGLCGHGGNVPVCAVKQKTLVTYVNSCVALGVHARVIAMDRGCIEGCPARYAPVCGTDTGGKRRLYGNACEAEKSGATDIRKGTCRKLFRRIASPGTSVGAVP